ncbi:MAG: tRNA pseudouridine synthase A, partial [Candidatus Omnitrophica bacterium]|nr:tRNA pseudouridine synthase A [Candidatus Omnitrophota bacterium]
MRNLKLTIEYDGTHYCGWQIQKRHPLPATCRPSIQETIEFRLRKILQEDVRLVGSGRTDAGVHALAQVANFKTASRIPPEKLKKALNGLLPDDISISGVHEVPLDFHARFSVSSKLYRYTILSGDTPSALLRNSVYFFPFSLEIRKMQKEARALVGKHNFKAFAASSKKERNFFRRVSRCSV